MNIYNSSYYHHQIESMNYYRLLRVRSWNNSLFVCPSIFLWICDMAGLLRGTFVSWWYLPRFWPSVTDMQHYNHARYPTDDWHLACMFSPGYFLSVEVYLVGVLPHSVSTSWDPCVRVYEPLTLASPSRENINRTGLDPAIYLKPSEGHLYWRMGLPALLC